MHCRVLLYRGGLGESELHEPASHRQSLRALFAGPGLEDAVESRAVLCLTARAEPIEPMNDALWEMLLCWELRACGEPGALDGGTHIVAVARRR